MKCTDKRARHIKKLLCLISIAVLCLTGCGNRANVSNKYNTYSSDYTAGSVESNFFASSLCVTDDINIGTGDVTSSLAEAAGLFNLDTQEVVYCQNIFQKMYPASTTKIMTAYIICRNCDLDDVVTVSYDAANPGQDSSVCGLKTGDQITVRDLLHGLLLASGNDAAIALAEYYSETVDAFVDIMNEEAASMGATGTHFANSCGLPDDDHYTTVYDMYLMFSQACMLQDFVDIAGTSEYTAEYENAEGQEVQNTWTNTCRYITGYVDAPEGVTIIAAKTGTTDSAGYCLCTYSENNKKQRLVTIVFKADARADLYKYMNEILQTFAN